MRPVVTPIIVATALLIAGCGRAEDQDRVARGRGHFQRNCGICHGTDARGMPRLGEDLHDNAFAAGLSDGELVDFLKKGRPAWDPLNERGVDMPPRGGNPALTDDDLLSIVAYLRTL